VLHGRILTVVYSVCDLLALGLAGAGCLSFCLAVESAIPDYRYHTARRIWPAKRDSFVASAVIARSQGDLKIWSEAGGLMIDAFRVNISNPSYSQVFWALFPLLTAFPLQVLSSGNPCGNRSDPVSRKVILGTAEEYGRLLRGLYLFETKSFTFGYKAMNIIF
jgi:hypothetical protein